MNVVRSHQDQMERDQVCSYQQSTHKLAPTSENEDAVFCQRHYLEEEEKATGYWICFKLRPGSA
jgi:hypothetical protein